MKFQLISYYEKVDFEDFAIVAGWQSPYDMTDLKEMAADWLIDCDITPDDPACSSRCAAAAGIHK